MRARGPDTSRRSGSERSTAITGRWRSRTSAERSRSGARASAGRVRAELGSTASHRAADGALGRNRTCDTRFRKPLLSPLSYEGEGCRKGGGELLSTGAVLEIEFTARRGPIAEGMRPALRVHGARTLRSQAGGVKSDSGGRREPAASLVAEDGQPVHEQRVADQVDLPA